MSTFDSFDQAPHDLSSPKNLYGSFGFAVALVLSLGYLAMQTGEPIAKEAEKLAEITFADTVEPKLPPPPKIKRIAAAAAPVIPAHLKKIVVAEAPPTRPLAAPIDVKQGPLAEADPALDKGVMVVGEGEGDPAGLEGGAVGGVAGGQVAKLIPEAEPLDELPDSATPPEPSDDNEPPVYPATAKAAGITNTVILKIVVLENGNVGKITVMKGDTLFAEAAVEAVKAWRYSPALADGKAAKVYRLIRIPFQLKT